MKAICVDDEKLVLEEMREILTHTGMFEDIKYFSEPREAVEYISENETDIAFLDISLSGDDGMKLAEKIREISPRTNIVFVTGYSEYTMEAFRVHAAGYLLKPVTEAAVLEQLEYMKNVVPVPCGKRFLAQTFGNFEFYIDGAQVMFSCAKSKELLAYLVDRRGASVFLGEAAAVLFEDRKNETSAKSGVRTALAELNKTLRQAQAGKLLIKRRASVALNAKELDCDYYQMLSGDADARNSYMGEYMSQYSWAEVTSGGLASIKQKYR